MSIHQNFPQLRQIEQAIDCKYRPATRPAAATATVVSTLHDTLATVTAMPEIVGKLGDSGMDMVGADPLRSATIVADEFALWARVIRSSGVKAE